MGKRFQEITPDLRRAIARTALFFVATAPLAADGHVNLSPKGYDTLRVLDPKRIAYLDLTGSGNETAAHISENARLTLMMCVFDGAPQIIRIYCRGRAISRSSSEWTNLSPLFPELVGARQIIIGDVEFVQTSCGYAVPEMALVQERNALLRWAGGKGEDGLAQYRQANNTLSIDGLPAPPTDN